MTLFNADDYGITAAQSRHIRECREAGALTGVSAMPNSPYLPEAMVAIEDDPALFVAVHLNLTEGCCLSDADAVPLLAAADGRFRRSFFGLFTLSLGAKRRALLAQMETELEAQIRRVLPLLNGRPLRLDGHQHIQMIPAVMRSIGNVLRRMELRASYIRYSCEPLSPYLRHPSLWRDYKPVNLLKNLVLNVFGCFDRGMIRNMGLAPNIVMGLVISGNLEYRLVSVLLPDFERIAARRGVSLELVMHPGWGVARGEGLDVPGGAFEAFYCDPGRKREYDCLQNVR